VASFAPPFEQAWKWEVSYPANWKVPVENTLEMYHLPSLHRRTLGDYRDESHYTHVLGDRCSTLHTTEYHPLVTIVQAWMLRRLGIKPTNGYVHHHVHPNTVFIGQDSMRLAEQFVPTGPTSAVQRVWVYAARGFRRNPLAFVIARLLRHFVTTITRRILTEDLPVFTSSQQGLQVSSHRGVLGTLEERIHLFQKYILEMCGEPTDSNGRPG
jgi:phenylpropionate dioxygenase-like ring-hydroxylating dioxygenase large terminal subunit